MEFREVLADINSTFKSHAAAGLIDEVSLYTDYLFLLKEFGSLPLEQYEDVVEVKNGKAYLPGGFNKLIIAMKCEPFIYETKYKDHLQDSRFWVERHEKSAIWDSCNDCCIEEGEKYIVEKLYYREYEADYYYKDPIVLSLVKGINKNYCANDCQNLRIHSSPYEINIVRGNILQTNFKTGNVFLKYYGYDEDEDGFVSVPDTYNGNLEQYIINELKARVLEGILASGDAVSGEDKMLAYFSQKARDYKVKAITELKAKNFNKQAIKSYKKTLKTSRKSFEVIS